jgi:hypothetical protein
LEGLVYDHFDDDSPLDVEDRLTWLARQYHSPAAPRDLPTAGTWPARPVVVPAAYQDVADEGSSDSASGPSAMMAPVGVIPSGDNSGESTPPQEFEPGEAEAAPLAVEPPAEEATEDPAARRYVTQPYTQLASVYRAIGQDEQANRVLVARAERLGELSSAFSAHGIWYRYFGRLIGYGYEPFRAVKIGIVIVLLGGVVFAIGNRRHLMAETKLAEHVLSQEGEPRLISPTYPRFNPLVYSLDVFLPFVNLQQICYWLPGENMAGPRSSRNCLLHLGPWSLKWSALLRAYLWFQTLAGWTLCTLLAAAVTGIVKS